MIEILIVNSVLFYIGFKMPESGAHYWGYNREIPFKIFGHSLVSVIISFFIVSFEPAFLPIAIGHLIHVLNDTAKLTY